MIEVHYLMTLADEKEVELFVENKPKELMKYGFKNEKLWTMFLDKDETVSIDEIEEAMSLASNL
tara:strand:- start:2500 stop:2691 length:192 start_codon:yes stop_codon:yes gene_type:complete